MSQEHGQVVSNLNLISEMSLLGICIKWVGLFHYNQSRLAFIVFLSNLICKFIITHIRLLDEHAKTNYPIVYQHNDFSYNCKFHNNYFRSTSQTFYSTLDYEYNRSCRFKSRYNRSVSSRSQRASWQIIFVFDTRLNFVVHCGPHAIVLPLCPRY